MDHAGTGMNRLMSTQKIVPASAVKEVEVTVDRYPDRDGTNFSSDSEHHYLTDATGNHGAMVAHDGANDYVYFQYFDAFGVPVDRQTFAPVEEAGEYNWRGREGSESDVNVPIPNDVAKQASQLVYMQARYYDPELGRFLQADPLPISSLSTQRINRYAYVNNDPVNLTDPLGYGFWGGAAAWGGFYSGFLMGEMAALSNDHALFGGSGTFEPFKRQLDRLLLDFAGMILGSTCSFPAKLILRLSDILDDGKISLPEASLLAGFLAMNFGFKAAFKAAVNPVFAARFGFVTGFLFGYVSFSCASPYPPLWRKIGLPDDESRDIPAAYWDGIYGLYLVRKT